MTTLALDTPRDYELGKRNDLPVAATTTIYEGAAVGSTGGYARPLTAGDIFHGFAKAKAANAAGAAGAIRVKLQDCGRIVLPISGAAVTDIDKAVYASDDNAFTFTATSNSYVGRVIRWVSTGIVVVAFDARLANLTAITDNSGGTNTSDTIAVLVDAGGTAAGAPTTASVAAALTCLAKHVNALIQLTK